MVGMNRYGDPPARPLYDRIEEIRVRRGLSKIEVARAAGVNRQTLANLSSQRRRPQPATVLQIADALGIGHDEALRLAGYPTGDVDQGDIVDRLTVQVEALRVQVDELTAELTELREKRTNGDTS